jgi:hypothetical protein
VICVDDERTRAQLESFLKNGGDAVLANQFQRHGPLRQGSTVVPCMILPTRSKCTEHLKKGVVDFDVTIPVPPPHNTAGTSRGS